jgi:hypothetical protein
MSAKSAFLLISSSSFSFNRKGRERPWKKREGNHQWSRYRPQKADVCDLS